MGEERVVGEKVGCGFDTPICFVFDTYTCVELTDRRRRQAILPPRARWRGKLLHHLPSTTTSTMAGTPLTFRGHTSLLLRLLLPVLIPLLPSFLHPHDPSKPLRRLHTTSYLDVLRGVAALIVLPSHFLTNWSYPLRLATSPP
jgi:hypothetical protein